MKVHNPQRLKIPFPSSAYVIAERRMAKVDKILSLTLSTRNLSFETFNDGKHRRTLNRSTGITPPNLACHRHDVSEKTKRKRRKEKGKIIRDPWLLEKLFRRKFLAFVGTATRSLARARISKSHTPRLPPPEEKLLTRKNEEKRAKKCQKGVGEHYCPSEHTEAESVRKISWEMHGLCAHFRRERIILP